VIDESFQGFLVVEYGRPVSIRSINCPLIDNKKMQTSETFERIEERYNPVFVLLFIGFLVTGMFYYQLKGAQINRLARLYYFPEK
jgi:hypothetical protein